MTFYITAERHEGKAISMIRNLWEISRNYRLVIRQPEGSPQFFSRKEGKGKMSPSCCLVTTPGPLNNDAGDTGRLRGSFSKTNLNCTQASEKSTMLRFTQGGKTLTSPEQGLQTSKGRLSGRDPREIPDFRVMPQGKDATAPPVPSKQDKQTAA